MTTTEAESPTQNGIATDEKLQIPDAERRYHALLLVAVAAVQSKHQTALTAEIGPLLDDLNVTARRIESILGLTEGSIGRTHHIADGEVRYGPPPASVPPLPRGFERH
jgi:hypothetical protein